MFYEELGAKRQLLHALEQRDADRFDEACDHLLVFDTSVPGPDTNRIVGTYRLLRQERTAITGGFYSNDEFDLDSAGRPSPGPALPRARPFLRAARNIARSAPSRCCGKASGPTSIITRSA